MKILGFDNWTGGAHLFARLVPAFRESGLELSLLHLGSWGNDLGRPLREQFGELTVTDIASYGTRSFPEILDTEKPAAVLFMSTDTFAHRAFNRYCRQRRIPTIHVYHGIVRVQDVSGGAMYKVNPIAQIRFALSKLGKAIKHVWPVYARSLWATGATLDEWLRFIKDIISISRGKYISVSALDAKTNKCGVYTETDRDHAITKYAFSSENVVAVGNPDLVQFGLGDSDIGCHIASPKSHCPDVMYVDTGLVYTGWVFTSEGDFIEHLLATKDRLIRQGRRLIFKPHPQHQRGSVLPALVEAGVEVCPNRDFVARLKGSCGCIVEPSSLSLIPALMGMPLFLINYGKLHGCRFGDVLHSYPRAQRMSDVDDLNPMLETGRAFDHDSTWKWIHDNAGPLPAEAMPHRVAKLVKSALH